MRWPRTLSGWVVFVAVVVWALFAFGVLEVGVRSLIPFHNYFANHRRSIRLSEHIPEQERVYTRDGAIPGMTGQVLVRTDHDGFLLPYGSDLSDRSRAADVTLAFLGGSTTESRWVDEALRWPYLTGVLLAQARGANVRVLNAGVTGTNLHHSLNVFVNKLLKHRPDVVVVSHVLNDCGLLAERNDYEDWTVQSYWRAGEGGTVRVLYEWATAHSEFLGLVRHRYAVWQITREQAGRVRPTAPGAPGVAAPPIPEARLRHIDALYTLRLRMLVGMIQASGARPVLVTETSRELARGRSDTPVLACYLRLIGHVRAIARETGAGLIDFERDILGIATPTGAARFYDSLHFTDEGSVEAAGFAASALLTMTP